MPFSSKLAELARDATIGMKDVQVLQKTGLSYATWHRILQGQIPGQDKLVQLAVGLGLDPTPFLQAALEVRGGFSPEDMMRSALEVSGLSQMAKMELMQHYRELVRKQQEKAEDQTAA